jgi:phage I-like protein
MMKDIIQVACRELEGVPSEIQVIPSGEHHTDKGPFLLDGEAAAEVMREAASVANDFVIDYEHQSLGDVEAPAAGWIKKLVNRGSDGIWAVVEWTPRAALYLKNREYRYLSPVFLRRLDDNRVVRFLHAALTNTPAIDGMIPIVNKAQQRSSAAAQHNDCATERQFKKKEANMERLFDLLGLKAGATEEQAVAALRALTEGGPSLPAEVLDLLDLGEGASLSEVTGTIQAMKQGSGRAEDLARRVKELEEKSRTEGVDRLVTRAMKDGKVTPAQADWAREYAERDPEGFGTFVARAPRVVDTGEIAAGGGTASFFSSLDETQREVNTLMGIDAVLWRKHNAER